MNEKNRWLMLLNRYVNKNKVILNCFLAVGSWLQYHANMETILTFSQEMDEVFQKYEANQNTRILTWSIYSILFISDVTDRFDPLLAIDNHRLSFLFDGHGNE